MYCFFCNPGDGGFLSKAISILMSFYDISCLFWSKPTSCPPFVVYQLGSITGHSQYRHQRTGWTRFFP